MASPGWLVVEMKGVPPNPKPRAFDSQIKVPRLVSFWFGTGVSEKWLSLPNRGIGMLTTSRKERHLADEQASKSRLAPDWRSLVGIAIWRWNEDSGLDTEAISLPVEEQEIGTWGAIDHPFPVVGNQCLKDLSSRPQWW